MSVPYSIITCIGCDSVWTSTMLHGSFVWRDLSGREHSMDREIGVCRACEDVVPKERLPNRDDFERAREARRLGWFQRWRLRRKVARESWEQSLEERALDPKFPFAVVEAVMNLQRPAVCLECASPEVSALPYPDHFTTRDERLHETGMMHPGCGGMLLVHGSGRDRIASYMRTYVFDVHGRHLETLERRN